MTATASQVFAPTAPPIYGSLTNRRRMRPPSLESSRWGSYSWMACSSRP